GDCSQPPRFAFAEPSTPTLESYPVGTQVRYRCRPGYTLAGSKFPIITCLPNSSWSENPDFCIGKPCGPPEIMNGKFHFTTDLLFGSTITFTCDVGYRLVGKSSAECVLIDTGVAWDNIPYCESIPCLPPPPIENGQLLNGNRDFTFGMSATYRCNSGFSLIGDDTIHCTADENLMGVWSGTAPECKVVRCENPEVRNGRRLSGFGTEHTYKNTVTFECNPGYLMVGSNTITCEADSTWQPPVPTCVSSCGSAPVFTFAEREGAGDEPFPAGTELTYRCKPGYTPAPGKSNVVTCLNDGTWSSDPNFCIRQECTRPMIENGNVSPNSFLFETVVTFSCLPGYELKGSSRAKCVASGSGVSWDRAFPRCEKKQTVSFCEDPPTISNGMHNGTKGETFVSGSVVVYKCKDGFTLTGDALLECVADEHQQGWSKPAPECKGDCLLDLSCCFLSAFRLSIFTF
ncbi:CR1 protein, partial [Aegotheles bennettii]|nr:CR1 protein [Aegotheles bennettii]